MSNYTSSLMIVLTDRLGAVLGGLVGCVFSVVFMLAILFAIIWIVKRMWEAA